MGNGGPGSDGQTLASSPADKKKAAKYLEEELLPHTKSAGNMAAGGGAVKPPFIGPVAPNSPLMKQDTGLKGLSGWASDQGLSDALVSWQGSANRLLGRLQTELSALHGTKNLFQGTDLGVQSQVNGIRPPSSFDGM
ncbi:MULTISPECIES: hypothetical protein [Streptomyces]|uniref:hypothetical protein n=1 Tax=Streptomyces TaxID=1883 RepID=UPI00210D7EFC|nr:hypothetical protein [Streptomyces longispororuber]MCQ4206845.1 hypothetical protein [Streptomyces longispororuber]